MEAVETYQNKQSILSRMLNLAAAIQGVNRSELLDPVVILFIESLAEEIYLLSREIENLEDRVLDKLSSILVSGAGAVACPAHSLLHVLPLEHKLELTATDSFTLNRSKKEQDKLSLYPVCGTPVYNGGIRYFIMGEYVYRVDRELTKTLITRSGTNRKELHEGGSFWIALELDNEITDIENLSFYINLSQGYNTADNLSRLLHANWQCGGQDVPVRRGLFHREEELTNPKLNLLLKSDNSRRVNREILQLYESHYITVSRPLDITGAKETFPSSLKPYFPEEMVSGFTDERIWFEITCPPDFTREMIQAIEISINIVPVSCKRLVNEVLQVNRHIPVIPLGTRDNESFLSVHSLSDSDGVRYYDIPLSDSQEEHYGVYSLGSSGFERFGANDAREYLASMTHLLDQQTASFFKKNSESKAEQTALQENVHRMVRELAGIVHSGETHLEVKNYLLLEQKRETEIYFLSYWTARSLAGETVKEDIPVRPSAGLQANPAGIHLIRPLREGKRTPWQYEKYNFYKGSLTEHPLLVTPEDIRRFCMKAFGGIVERAEVGSGYKKSDGNAADFIKTTDVYLYLRKSRQEKTGENFDQYIAQVLQEHSPATFSYRVILKQ